MPQQIYYISALRVAATFLVILIHASTGYLNVFDAKSVDWNYANVLHSFSRCAVPLFVLISGALLLTKKEDSFVFYKKRMSRIVWPFLFWTVVYLIYYFYRYTNVDVLPMQRLLEISLDKVLHGSSAHLWFLYMIIGLYLAVPFLQMIVQQASDKELALFLAFWFASLIIRDSTFYTYSPKIDLSFFSGYVGYLVLGYFLATRPIRIPILFTVVLILLLGLGNTWGTWTLSKAAGKYIPTFYNYLGLTNALLATLVFLLFKKTIQHPMPKALEWIDQHSFGIYLIHILVLNYIHPLVGLPTLWKIPVAAILTLVLSLLLIRALRMLPLGKVVSG